MNHHHDESTAPGQASPEHDAAYAALLRDALRASERSLDPAVTGRLREARARAVSAAARPGLRWPWMVAVPAVCAAAFAGWVALSPLRQMSAAPALPTQSAQIEVLELLGSDDAPLTDDDVEFVRFLDAANGDS